jgi:hypothetical protein
MEHNGREEKNPWSKWYWADWLADPAIRISSLSAKGLWIDLLAILATSKIRGVLVIPEKQNSPIFGKDVVSGKQNKSKIEAKYLSKFSGETPEAIEILLVELETNGVFSRDEYGRIYNRRMIREKQISEIRAEAGRRGGRPSSQKSRKSKSKTKGRSASASASASVSLNSEDKERRSGGEIPDPAGAPVDVQDPEPEGDVQDSGIPLDKLPADYLETARRELPDVFAEAGHSDLLKNQVFFDYLVALCWEYRDLEDLGDIIKGKFAHWIKCPLTKKSNICLQFRNWFRNERRFEAERARERQVGKYKPEK